MSKQSQFSLREGEWIDGTPYRVVRALGLGGMGEVYEVDHTRTGTRRAIKLLRNACDPCGNSARRLLREGRVLSRIDHANVVRVYEVGAIADGRPYFAMQLLDGTNLRRLLSWDQRLDTWRAVRIALQALEGLQAVHAHGIVHRDLKPSNLFVCTGERIKVLDFGVSKLLYGSTASPSTAQGLIIGTMRYMAPEQLTGGPVGQRADVYSMGLVLFELIAGRYAFQGLDGTDWPVLARIREPPPRLSLSAGQPIPGPLDAVIAQALNPDPERRFGDAKAFADALVCAMGPAILGGASPHPQPIARMVQVQWPVDVEDDDERNPTQLWSPAKQRPAEPGRAERPQSKRHRLAAVALVSLFLVGILGAFVLGSALTQVRLRGRIPFDTAAASCDLGPTR